MTYKTRIHFPPLIVGLIIVVSFTAGCTPEKAQAVKAAAALFRDQALAAIEAYEKLILEGTQRLPETDRERLDRFVAGFEALVKNELAAGKDPPTTADMIGRIDRARQQRLRSASISKQFDGLRRYYISYVASFESLPEASFLAARDVSCTGEIGVRLVGTLNNMAKEIAENHIYAQQRMSTIRAQWIKAIKMNKPKHEQAEYARQFIALKDESDELNLEAVKKSLVAAEQGLRVVKQIQNYDSISVSDILNIITFGLNFENSLQIDDAPKLLMRVNDLQTRLNGDPQIKRILDIEVGEDQFPCVSNKEGA